MPILTGSISPWGPAIHVKVMQTGYHVELLKKSDRQYSPPKDVPGGV